MSAPNQTTLVVGASGMTGKYLVQHLLDQGQAVKAVVRSADKLPAAVREHRNLTVIQAGIAEMGVDELAGHVKGCSAVASCLGHNLSFQGMFRDDHLLCTHAIQKLCQAVEHNEPTDKVKVVLMNTVGAANNGLEEHKRRGWGEAFALSAIRLMIPPHSDNEKANEYLRVKVGQSHKCLEYVVVRPDSLTDADKVTKYFHTESPVKSIFNGYSVTRTNVAHFMSTLVTDNAVWGKWKGQMPCVFDSVQQGGLDAEAKHN